MPYNIIYLFAHFCKSKFNFFYVFSENYKLYEVFSKKVFSICEFCVIIITIMKKSGKRVDGAEKNC